MSMWREGMHRIAPALCGATATVRSSAVHGCKAKRILSVQCRSILTIKKSPILANKPAPYAKKKQPKAAPLSNANDADGEGDVSSSPSAPVVQGERKTARLAKRIAMSGLCSRREAEKYIESHDVTVNGKVVTVNGKVVTDLATVVDVKHDVVAVDGRTLTSAEKLKVWMANKLAGVRGALP